MREIPLDKLEIPDFTFRPNIWTEAFLEALSTVDIKGKKVVELGVGSGIVGIDLVNRGVNQYVGLDIDERILPVARRNMERCIFGGVCKIDLLSSDLLASIEEDNSFDLICGCLPQVCKPTPVIFGTADSYARYFDPKKYGSDLNVYGLGLNESALIQSKTRLDINGRVILVLSGRAGKEILNQMFERNGFSSEVLVEKNIPQLRETSLATLVEYEKSDYEFFFYKDQQCEERISVAEAEQRRLQGDDSYHKLYVMEGKITFLRQNL